MKLHIWLVWVGTQLKQLLSGVPDALWVRYLDLSMKNEPNFHIIMVQGVKNHKIRICEQNLYSEHLKLHIWSVWVGTQLKELLSGVPDALWVRYLDLSMKNEPNFHIIMVQGVKNHKIRICEQNLYSEHLKLHIWSVWVGTQLKQLLSAVPDALWVRFVDLNIANGPNFNENRG